MKSQLARKHTQGGSSLIEVLVTLLILLLGLLGLVGLMVQSQRSQQESYQRVQALVLLDDMVNRINANRKVAPCYVVTTNADGSPFLGNQSTVTPSCTTGTAEQQLRAVRDMTEWNDLLLGSTEKAGGNNVGGMIGARGCVEQVSVGVYRVTVAWQGNSETFPPTVEVACATGKYGSSEALRRAVSVNLLIANVI